MNAAIDLLPLSLMKNGNPHQVCIDACAKCAQICGECFNLCLLEKDVKERTNCIKTLQDCAEICTTAACFMSRESGSIKEVCSLCAEVCERCATECDMFQDQHCKTCADTCRQCANECRHMANI